MRKYYLSFLLAALHVSVSTQMNPGDALIVTGQQLQVYRGGTVVLRYIVPTYNLGLTMENQNVDVVLSAAGNPGGSLHVLSPPGTFRTLAVLARTADRITVAENGDVLAALISTAGQLDVVRVDQVGRQTTIRGPVIGGRVVPGCFTVDIGTGDWLIGNGFTLYRMRPSGQTTVITGSLRFMYQNDVVSDPRTGLALVASHTKIVAVDPRTGAVVPLANFPRVTTVSGLAYDRARDDFLFVTAGGDSLLGRISRQGVVTTLMRGSGMVGTDVDVYARRHIVPLAGNPTVGTTFPMRLWEGTAPTAPFIAAASFGLRPGIVTPAGIVDLRADPLFWLSLRNPAVFRGFTGRLDMRGIANASIAIPAVAALRGVRFYLSFVTFPNGRLTTIANTAGFTIR